MARVALRSQFTAPEYLLVAQHEIRIEHFRRAADRGWFYAAYGRGEHIVLTNGATLSVDTIYARAFDLPADVA